MPVPQLLIRSERYSEGCVVGAAGELYFSMTALSTICCCSPSSDGVSEVRTWSSVPAANGHAIAPDGSHLVMSSAGSIVRLDATGGIARIIATEAGGTPLVYPNDVVLDSRRGGAFCTDSGYTSTPAHIDGVPRGRIVRVQSDDTVRVVADGIAYANGIALSPDGRTLYLSESTTGCLWRYAVDEHGDLGFRTLFARTPSRAGTTAPDGLTLGPDGRLYVAHYGAGEVLVYEVNGTLAARLDAGNRATSHVAFDRSGTRLYVSGGIDDESGAGAIFTLTVPS